ncbi:MAG TPA: formaldehyde-activating enzyme [Pirellulales bacterium]|nr:formaldehyde-activating enzyme [Pirellulales bacterium]
MNHRFMLLVALSIFLPAQSGCSSNAVVGTPGAEARAMKSTQSAKTAIRNGEALVGEGNEIAHIVVTIGAKDGPVGFAFANALVRQSAGHTCQLVVLEPNLAVKPSTAIVEMVTESTMKQATNFHGPIQAGVAQAVVDCVREGIISNADAESLVILCCAFLHPSAEDEKKIHDFNYDAAKLAIQRAFTGEPTIDKVIAARESEE